MMCHELGSTGGVDLCQVLRSACEGDVKHFEWQSVHWYCQVLRCCGARSEEGGRSAGGLWA